GMPAGIYATNTAEQCWYIAHHCEARVAVVEDETQLGKFFAFRDGLPALRAIVLMHGEPPANAGAGVYSWRALLERGATVPDAAVHSPTAARRRGGRGAHRRAAAGRRLHTDLHVGHHGRA